VNGSDDTGGLVGSSEDDTTIKSVTASGTVNGSDDTGGLVGDIALFRPSENTTIQNATATGAVTGSYQTGGLVGASEDDNTIESATASGAVTGSYQTGGLVGSSGDGTTIKSVTASGTVNGSDVTGGLVGASSGNIQNSTASGAVNGSRWTGGLVGESSGNIQNATASGAVSGSRYTGGLVGRNEGEIRDTVAVGSVTGEDKVGGLVGESDSGTVVDSYWDEQATGQSTSAGDEIGLTTPQMTGEAARTNMSALDFENAWQVTDGYPELSPFSETDAGEDPPDSGTIPIVNTTTSSVSPTTGTTGESQIYEVTVTVENTSLNATANGEVTVQFDGFNLSVDDDDEDDVRIDYTGLNVSNGTISVTETVSGTAPSTAGTYPINVTDVEVATGSNTDEFLLKDKHILIETVEVDNGAGGDGDNSTQVDTDPDELPGDGTEAEPYQISNASELQAMEDDLDAHYELVSDVDASSTAQWNDGSGFDPVGGSQSSFSGSLDGNHHTVTGLTINRSTENRVGLFGTTGSATFTSVSLTNLTVSGSERVGGLVGDSSDDTTIQNATASGAVNGSDDTGGLVGWSDDNTTIQNVTASGAVSGSRNTGGLVGWSDDNTTIQNATASGAVNGSDDTGGLVGRSTDTTVIQSATASGTVNGSINTGGLIGLTDDNTTIQNVTASGDVTGSDFGTGGLVGRSTDTTVIQSATASGTVDGSDTTGGLVGGSSGSTMIKTATASGDVNGSVNTGGLIGYNLGDEIRHTFAVGSVNGENGGGGLVGRSVSGTVVDSYWDEQATGQDTSAGNVTGLMTAQMTGNAARTNMSALDFENTWQVTDGYPELRVFSETNDSDDGNAIEPVPFPETTQPGQTNPTSLAGKFRVEDQVASSTNVTLLRNSSSKYSMNITAPNGSENVTFYLQERAISASQDIDDVRMLLDGQPREFIITENAGPGNSPWIAFTVPEFSTRTVTFTSESDGGDTAPVISAPSNDTYDPSNPLTIETSHNATGVINDSDVAVRLVNATDGNNTEVALNGSVPSEGTVKTTISAGSLSGNVTIETQLYNGSSSTSVANDTIELTADTSSGDNGGSDGGDGSDDGNGSDDGDSGDGSGGDGSDPDPQAVINTNSTTVTVDQVISFSASESTGTDFQWEFDDGRNATGETTSHTYNSPGTYTVTLTVAEDGTTATDEVNITVAEAVTADIFTGTETTGVGDTIEFDAIDSSGGAGNLSYDWQFGDGTSASGENVTHEYTDTGTYTVELTVTDPETGATATDTVEVEITDQTDYETPGFGPLVSVLTLIAFVLIARQRRD
jgi:PKD repeat protein